MKRLLVAGIGLLIAAVVPAQNPERYRIGTDETAAFARTDNCYHSLMKRFYGCDPQLTSDNLRKLCYGFAARPVYQGDLQPAQYRIAGIMKEGKQNKALELAGASLPGYPASPRLPHYVVSLGRGVLPDETVGACDRMFHIPVKTIRESGDGSREDPYRVIVLSDEYDFLLRFIGTSEITGQSHLRPDNERIYGRMKFEPVDNDFYHGKQSCFDTTPVDLRLKKLLGDEKD